MGVCECLWSTRKSHKAFSVFHLDSIFTMQAKPMQEWRDLHKAQNQIKVHLQVPGAIQREVL